MAKAIYWLQYAKENTSKEDFFKLINNSLFGKTTENLGKTVDVKLVTSKEGLLKLQSLTKVLGHMHFFSENFPFSISPSPYKRWISGLKVHVFGATLTRGEGGRHFAQTRASRASKTERLANTCHIFRLPQGLLSRIVASKPTYVVAVHKIKETLMLNRLAYVGMCILELSKTLMYIVPL